MILAVATFAACAYECWALLPWTKAPTISTLIKRHRHMPGVELAVWALLIKGWHHWLKEPA